MKGKCCDTCYYGINPIVPKEGDSPCPEILKGENGIVLGRMSVPLYGEGFFSEIRKYTNQYSCKSWKERI